MKARAQKRTTGFAMIFIVIIAGVILGAASFFAAKIINDRKEHQVAATVRIADGTTEDEVAVVSATITKKGQADKIIFTKSSYMVSTVRLPDNSSLQFTNCTLGGVYEPERCSTTNGGQYWVTLTEAK